MSAPAQSASSHAQYVPGFHFVTGSIVLVSLVWSLYHTVKLGFTSASLDLVAINLSLLGIFWYSRQFGVKNQDRIIRLEERVRLAAMPDDISSRAHEFTADQLIAMRFASDAELPDLARTVLSKGATGRAEIKGMIKEWRPDHMRV